jgi:hypothetical protein
MNRRGLLGALVIPVLGGGCTPPGSEAPRTAIPPAGAITAGAAYPAIGARWKVRVAERSLFHHTSEDRDIAAAPIEFNGQKGYGLTDGSATRVLDPATFNNMGSVSGGRVASVYTPEVGPFFWPLWVGKSWTTRYSYVDFVYGQAWAAAKAEFRVAAIEDVTIPAGTFQTFRIVSKTGIGTSSSSGRRGNWVPGIESSDVHWYAPGVKTVVKIAIDRSGSNYLGAGQTTSELLSLPA